MALAERLDIHPRSLRRDIERLRALGYSVHAAPGSGGGDRLGQGAAALPLLFERRRSADRGSRPARRRAAAPAVRGMGAAAARVMARLDPLLPRRSGQRASAAHAAMASMPAAEAEPLVDAALLAQLAAACRDRVTLRLDYRRHSGAAITRSVEPTLRVNDGRRWYLLVWDCERQDWRSLRPARIDRAAATGAQFAPVSARGTAAAVVQSRWRSTVPVPSAVPPGWYGGDTGSPHSALVGCLEADGPAHCWLGLGAPSMPALAANLLPLDLPFDAIAPDQARAALTQALNALCAQLARKSGQQTLRAVVRWA